MNKKIFLAGGRGFIGKNIKEQLEKKYNIFSPTSEEMDLLDTELVTSYIKRNNFDCIIYAATHYENVTSTRDTSKVLENNLRMFFNLAKNNKYFGKMIYFGSGAEYDMYHYIPKMKEEYFDTYIPIDQYGFSKYISSKYIESAENIYDLRLFGCFGKHEDWRIRFISQAICKVIYGYDITINQNVYFDYLYINDLVRIVKWFIEKDSFLHRHYNITTGSIIDLKTIANKIIKISGKKHLKVYIRKRGLKPEYSGNNMRLLLELNNFIFTPIDISLQELFDWYSQNKNKVLENELFLV